jgi:hypothetical protein
MMIVPDVKGMYSWNDFSWHGQHSLVGLLNYLPGFEAKKEVASGHYQLSQHT